MNFIRAHNTTGIAQAIDCSKGFIGNKGVNMETRKSEIPDSIQELVRDNERKPISQPVTTLASIQSIAKKLWEIAQNEGYEPSGNWEYLNNLWIEQAIKYVLTRGLASQDGLIVLARAQLERQESRNGVYLTKTGRLACFLADYCQAGRDKDVTTSVKTKQYRKDSVNPHTEHIWTTLDGTQKITREQAKDIIQAFKEGRV
jgi:hypothetical protein